MNLIIKLNKNYIIEKHELSFFNLMGNILDIDTFRENILNKMTLKIFNYFNILENSKKLKNDVRIFNYGTYKKHLLTDNGEDYDIALISALYNINILILHLNEKNYEPYLYENFQYLPKRFSILLLKNNNLYILVKNKGKSKFKDDNFIKEYLEKYLEKMRKTGNLQYIRNSIIDSSVKNNIYKLKNKEKITSLLGECNKTIISTTKESMLPDMIYNSNTNDRHCDYNWYMYYKYLLGYKYKNIEELNKNVVKLFPIPTSDNKNSPKIENLYYGYKFVNIILKKIVLDLIGKNILKKLKIQKIMLIIQSLIYQNLLYLANKIVNYICDFNKEEIVLAKKKVYLTLKKVINSTLTIIEMKLKKKSNNDDAINKEDIIKIYKRPLSDKLQNIVFTKDSYEYLVEKREKNRENPTKKTEHIIINVDGVNLNFTLKESYIYYNFSIDDKKENYKQVGYLDEENNYIFFEEHKNYFETNSWILGNRYNFYKQTFIKDYNSLNKFPFNHYQKLIRDFLNYRTPYRSLLVYHGLGTGKTCSSIAVSSSIEDGKILVLLPAALRTNFINGIKKCGNYVISQYSWIFMDKKDIIFNQFKYFYYQGKIINLTNYKTGIWIDHISFYKLKKQGLRFKYKKKGEEIVKIKHEIFSSITGYSIQGEKIKKMTRDELKSLNRQINTYLNEKYTFINYPIIENNKSQNINKTRQFLNNIKKNKHYLDTFKLIIIDEVHELINHISNNKQIELYRALLSTSAKLVLLSGTPIYNTIYEIPILLNVVKGIQYTYILKVDGNYKKIKKLLKNEINNIDNIELVYDTGSIEISINPYNFVNIDNSNDNSNKKFGTYQNIFTNIQKKIRKVLLDNNYTLIKPIEVNERVLFSTQDKYVGSSHIENVKTNFRKNFVDTKVNTLKNTFLLKNRMVGTLSYYEKKDFPTIKEYLEKIEMNDKLYDFYNRVYKKEKSRSVTSLYVHTRQVSLFLFPLEFIKTVPKFKNIKSYYDFYDKRTDKDHNNFMTKIKKYISNTFDSVEIMLQIYSPKYLKILEKILNTNDSPIMIYSDYKKWEGLAGIFTALLELFGYKDYFETKDNKKYDYKRFLLWETTPKKIATVDKIFNSINNKDGKLIKIIMLTESASRGINLKFIKNIHIVNPNWKKTHLQQVIGRAVRLDSHLHLLDEYDNIQDIIINVVQYLLSYSISQKETIHKEKKVPLSIILTGDEYVKNKADKKYKIINQMLMLMREVSINCESDDSDIGCFSKEQYNINVPLHTNNYLDDIKRNASQYLDVPIYKAQKNNILYVSNKNLLYRNKDFINKDDLIGLLVYVDDKKIIVQLNEIYPEYEISLLHTNKSYHILTNKNTMKVYYLKKFTLELYKDVLLTKKIGELIYKDNFWYIEK